MVDLISSLSRLRDFVIDWKFEERYVLGNGDGTFGVKDGKQLAPVDRSTPGAVYDLLLPIQSGVFGSAWVWIEYFYGSFMFCIVIVARTLYRAVFIEISSRLHDV
ncbi:hypothetical protein CGLO_10893 [Colletotrichum gloeosporioides Cg-14]|uniref:Uncharacterized protein n=1 Tax=Colletotrichum gloeosporioides (strain Cg-14) TaxID=1237896 RepID=T0LDD2_COLGC|nr:hypothetical protein CGLO_10893 [Colletotrichum gloeosporioides Cg-14]